MSNTNKATSKNTDKKTGTTSKATNSEKAWFRKVKNTWYAWKDGKQVSLGVKGEENYELAKRAFYLLMATGERGEREQPTPKNQEQEHVKQTNNMTLESSVKKYHDASSHNVRDDDMMMTPEEMEAFERRIAERIKSAIVETNTPKTGTTTIQQLVAGFLKDKQGEISQEAWRGYAKFLNPFAAKFGERPAETLTPEEAEDFTKKAEWSSTYRADFLGTLISVYRWGVRKRLLTSSPVEGVKKPPKQSRGTKAVISEDEHKKLLEHADDDFRDLLVMLKYTGARPSEITGLTAEQVNQFKDGLIPLEKHKTANKGKSRFLILRGEALELATKRANQVKTGLLFTGQNGQLTPKAISAKMERTRIRAGLRQGIVAYGYRHSFATDALAKGESDSTVAALLGHADTSMIHKHYSHLASQSRALREAMARIHGDRN